MKEVHLSAAACRLAIKLQRFRACNAVLVKLVDSLCLLGELLGGAEFPHPDIDVTHVIFSGSHIVLPDGLAVGC